MNYDDVLKLLDYHTKIWASTLTVNDLASIISSTYRIPGVINALKHSHGSSPAISQSVAAADIGKTGETTFEDMCKTLPVNYKIINTSKAGHAGDFIIEFSKDCKVYRCLVDIKTYKGTVPKKEIDKFTEDMMYGSYDSGLMISYASKFVGINDSIYIDTKILPYGRIPIMFLSDIPHELIIQCIEVLCTKMTVSSDHKINLTQVESSMAFINTSLCQSSTTRRLLSELQTNTTVQIQRCQEHLIGCEVHIKQALNQMKKEIHRLNKTEFNNYNLNESSNLFTLSTVDIPIIKLRGDNVDDISITTTEYDFPPAIMVDNDVDNVDNEDTDGDGSTSFNYSKFCIKDTSLMKQLVMFEWSNILQDGDGTTSSFIAPFAIIHATPLKTKTRIEMIDLEIHEQHIIVPDDILKLFTKKVNKYTGTINQNLIDILHKYFK
jgi:hypothetical protein